MLLFGVEELDAVFMKLQISTCCIMSRYRYAFKHLYIYIYVYMVPPPSCLPFLGEVKEVFRVQG